VEGSRPQVTRPAYPEVARWARLFLLAILVTFLSILVIFILGIAGLAVGEAELGLLFAGGALLFNIVIAGVVLALRPVYSQLGSRLTPLAVVAGLTAVIAAVASHVTSLLAVEPATVALSVIAAVSYAAWLAIAAWAWYQVDRRPSSGLVTTLTLIAASGNLLLAATELGLIVEDALVLTVAALLDLPFYFRLARHLRPIAAAQASAVT
jgi:hypothetical protein